VVLAAVTDAERITLDAFGLLAVHRLRLRLLC
jgi:hypothetical protein